MDTGTLGNPQYTFNAWHSLAAHRALTLATVGAAYFAAAWLSYRLGFQPGGMVVVWLPAGVLLGALLLVDRRLWPFAIGGALVGNIGADLNFAGPHWWSFAGAGVNALESYVAARLLQRYVSPLVTFGALRDVLGFLALAVGLTNAVTALPGALVITHGHVDGLSIAWVKWWVGDGMGMMMMTPPVITLWYAFRARRLLSTRQIAERLLSLAAFTVSALLLLNQRGDAGIWHPAFVLLPLLMALAIRSGPSLAAAGTLVVYAIAGWHGVHARYLFAEAGTSPLLQAIAASAFLALISITTLITASILNEREVAVGEEHESQTRLRQIAEYMREACFLMEMPNRVPLYVNPAWSTISGHPMSDAYKPSSWLESVVEEDREIVSTGQAANARGESADMAFRITRPDGERRMLRARTYPILNDAGLVVRVVGLAEDVTELRATEDRLRQSEKLEAVGSLAGGVAHDFNNILTVILSYTGLMLAEEELTEDQRSQLDAIRQAADSAATLTRQLLVFSRRQAVQRREIHVNDRVNATGRLLGRLIGEHIQVQISAQAVNDVVIADPVQMEQVIVNLAVNARDAMPQGGTMRIETRNESIVGDASDAGAQAGATEYLVIDVSDTGAGMDEATKARIFEPFFTTKEHGRGTGLGLATVHGIVTACEGRIEVDSTIGVGTTFHVYLPSASAPAARVEESSPSAAPRGTESVVLVEDNVHVRTIIRDVLSDYGYQVAAFSDAPGAIEWALRPSAHAHLLVTDLVLPGLNGRELADILTEAHPDMRVLFVSGHTEDVVLQQGLDHDHVYFLEKPFTAGRLARRVRAVLDS